MCVVHGLPSQRDGTHWTTGVSVTTTSRNRQLQVLSDIAGKQRGIGIGPGQGHQRTAAFDDAVSRSDKLRHESLLAKRGDIGVGGKLIGDRQLRCDLTVPITRGTGELLSGDCLFRICVNEAGIDRFSGEIDFSGVCGNLDVGSDCFDPAVSHDHRRGFGHRIRMPYDHGTRDGKHSRRIRAQCFLRR